MANGGAREEKGTVVTLATRPGTHLTLAQNLERTERHPVLIFGASGAGKTQLLVSFILALRASGDIAVKIGEPVLDRADPRCEEKHRAAKSLFERQPYFVDAGYRVPSTQIDPFFVPIDVTPRNSQLKPVQFAFLDSRGELYQPNQAEDMDFYKPFSDEIRDLLQNFSHGITVIYAAPYSIGMGHDRDTRECDFGLLGAIDSYREMRMMQRSDFHLFLLTKWDRYASPMSSDGLFEAPSPDVIDRLLKERYRHAWGAFQALPLDGAARDRRAFTQYTSGHFSDDGRLQQPQDRFVSSFNRYPRTVLNWLYGNATRFKLANETTEVTLRKILFDDVVAPDTPRVTMTERLAALLTAR